MQFEQKHLTFNSVYFHSVLPQYSLFNRKYIIFMMSFEGTLLQFVWLKISRLNGFLMAMSCP